MNKAILITLSGCILIFQSCGPVAVREGRVPEGRGLTLAHLGKTPYRIVIGCAASPAEVYAASEFQQCFRQSTGMTLDIVRDDVPPIETEILIGPSSRLALAGLDANWDQGFGEDGFRLMTAGKRLVIAGGRPRGTLYGVYQFLQQQAGCRWYTTDVEYIPVRKTFRVPALDETIHPGLEYRETFYWEAFDGDFAARNFCNGNRAELNERHGGKIVFYPFVHTFYLLVPPELYFEKHPEYFSEIEGKRTCERTQLCLSNPEVLNIAVEKVKEYIRNVPGIRIVSVSQNDWFGYCTCPECKSLDEAEGSPSASVLRFVNKVAEAIEKDYPQVAIETLAYQYTRKPPKTIRPRDNVIVRLCSIECCFAHPLEEENCAENVKFKQDIEAWSKIADRLYVWDYVTDFPNYLLPFPNLNVLAPNVRFFVNHGVKGLFEQGNYGPNGGGEMANLRAWILLRLLWNPQENSEALKKEFVKAYYGSAAPFILRYIDRLHAEVTQHPDRCALHSVGCGTRCHYPGCSLASSEGQTRCPLCVIDPDGGWRPDSGAEPEPR